MTALKGVVAYEVEQRLLQGKGEDKTWLITY